MVEAQKYLKCGKQTLRLFEGGETGWMCVQRRQVHLYLQGCSTSFILLLYVHAPFESVLCEG